ncbi:MAG: ATP-binding protein [Thalassobaculaceae bacterium]
MITSWDQHQPWSAAFVDRLAAVNREAGAPLTLFFEHLDISRAGALHSATFAAYLSAKYKDQGISTILAESIPATLFLNAARDLLPSARRVLAVSGAGRGILSQEGDRTIQVPIDNRYADSLHTALAVTGARAVYVVADTQSPGGSKRFAEFMTASAERFPDLPVEAVDASGFEDVLKQVSNLPADALVYYLLVFRDGAGNALSPFVAARMLSDASPVPVFTNWEVMLGSGITGGFMISSARVADRVFWALTERESEGAARDAPNAYGTYFDWHEVERRGIPLRALPPGAEIRNREPGLLETHLLEVSAAVAAVVLLTAMSIALAILLSRVRAARNRVETARASLELRVAERTADLNRATEEAVTANAQKTEFLANMSHEIRTPLAGILGLADLILEAPDGTATVQHAERVKNAGNHLLSVVNDILDYTKLTAGKVSLAPEPFALKKLSEAICATFGPLADQNAVDLTVTRPEAWGIVGDEFRLRQVLFNLVGNAIKATKEGYVSVKISLLEEPGGTSGRATLAVEVIDTGSGMAENDLKRVFEPYVQAGKAGTMGGTGLGLAICSSLVRAMGGEISVKSELGVGSSFAFSIPTEIVELDQSSAPPPVAPSRCEPAQADRRILVADDDELNRILVEAALTKFGYSVTLVANGQEALCAARCQHFDGIVLDIQMPTMNGLQALAAIKAEGLADGGPVIALTADVIPENVARYRSAGFDVCLSKPFDWDALDLALRS